MKYKIKCNYIRCYADLITPVSVFLTIRNLFHSSILLESSEITDKTNARSIICANPIASFDFTNNIIKKTISDNVEVKTIHGHFDLTSELKAFFNSFEVSNQYEGLNGFFGFQSFEAIKYFEKEKANLNLRINPDIAIVNYRLFKYVISINHFNNEVIFIENCFENETSSLDTLVNKVLTIRSGTYPFKITSSEKKYTSEREIFEIIEKSKQHCQLGNVFQIVPSRLFSVNYQGDEFNVYRMLRHINPSPYMFYFDFGNYKIFGSSPEAQLRIYNGYASINPIAGTYRRTGNNKEDEIASRELLKDSKELAEHSMLVDLARNDLNRSCTDVTVEEYQTIKMYSHVIHIVSTVKGKVKENISGIEVLADTFPAGTLTGAPKIRAIQIISELESTPRSFYGGSIGFIDFNGELNQAIIIRSLLAHKNSLYYRAGAGVVVNSKPKSEIQEINNKLAAVRQAIKMAENI